MSNPTEQSVFKLIELDEMIASRRDEVAVRLQTILEWLNTIPDANIRSMIHWHYLQGLDWGRTCMKVYGYHNYHTCRNAVLRYMGVRK